MSATAGAGLFAAFIPLLLGLIADRWGIASAMQLLVVAPIAVFCVAVDGCRRSGKANKCHVRPYSPPRHVNNAVLQ